MKQRLPFKKKRGTDQRAVLTDLSDIGVERVHYNPADDFFVVRQENLSGSNYHPGTKGRKRKGSAKSPRVKGNKPAGGALMLLLIVCLAVPAITMAGNPATDTSAVMVTDPLAEATTAKAAAEVARKQENARAAAAQVEQDRISAQAAAAAAAAQVEQDRLAAQAAAEQDRLAALEDQGDAASYENCTDVWNELERPIRRNEPGFSAELDGNNDGIGCESRPRNR